MSKREKLAKLAHEQWSGWIDYMFGKCVPYQPSKVQAEEGALIIPKWAVDRWQRQAKTQYSELTPAEMDSDRKEADKFLDLLESESEPTEFIRDMKYQLYEVPTEDTALNAVEIAEKCFEEIYRLTAENKEKTIALANELEDCKPFAGAKQLQDELKAKDVEIVRQRGSCICMDCGKVIKVKEQSNHIKKCTKSKP